MDNGNRNLCGSCFCPSDETSESFSLAENNRLVNETVAGEFLGVTPRAMQAWRYKGGGPVFVKISARCVRYRIVDLMDFIESRLAHNTSESVL